jgi:hypothetical protein
MILDNRRVTVDEVQHQLRNSHEIIEDRLGFLKICARRILKEKKTNRRAQAEKFANLPRLI